MRASTSDSHALEPTSIPTVPRPLVRINIVFTLVFLTMSWMTGIIWFAAVPLVASGLGAAIGWNPVIAAAKTFLCKPASAYVPEDKAQLRFNQLLKAAMLTAALVSAFAGWELGFYLFTILPAAASLGALLGFCVGCIIRYRWLQYRHTRNRA